MSITLALKYTDWYICDVGSKAELTTKYILQTVAPVFNRMGYKGTSMSDLVKATKLTKGAIYGNFESKEDLAVQAFNFNVRKIIWLLADKMNAESSPTAKLFVMTDFYRNYIALTKKHGGCPLLNVGIDSKHQNPALSKRVKEIVKKLVKSIADIIRDGVKAGEFKKDVDAEQMALRIFSIIEGGVYTTTILDSPTHMIDMMDHLDAMIKTELIR